MKKILALFLASTGFAASPTFIRADWLKAWGDQDKDCQDTRQEVLIQESLVPVTLDSKKCKVVKGLWLCLYTGRVVTDPNELEIDHLVPLKNVFLSGGVEFDKDLRKSYAQDLEDPNTLIAVVKSANRSKQDRGPNEWMPPFQPFSCEYLSRWAEVKENWGLSMTSAESTKVYGGLAGCP